MKSKHILIAVCASTIITITGAARADDLSLDDLVDMCSKGNNSIKACCEQSGDGAAEIKQCKQKSEIKRKEMASGKKSDTSSLLPSKEIAVSHKEADINSRNQNGDTALSIAAYDGQKDVVGQLIAKGADVNTRNNYGATPLHLAINTGHTDVVELLVAKGADVNAKDSIGQTPLYTAAGKGSLDVVKLMIDKGADINNKGNDGKAPLHAAANNGRDTVVDILIAKGADVNIKDNDGRTPLAYATAKNKISIAEKLRQHNAEDAAVKEEKKNNNANKEIAQETTSKFEENKSKSNKDNSDKSLIDGAMKLKGLLRF